jgi:SAM-dependent methyltransferase
MSVGRRHDQRFTLRRWAPSHLEVWSAERPHGQGTPMDLDEYRRSSHETWETLAPGWERRREAVATMAGPVRDWLVHALAPQPGETLLELSAGPGEVGFEAAPHLEERGRLIRADFSPGMVEVARRRGAELGLGNVDYRVIDAERIDLDADSVDAVLCRFGYMLMADPAAALAETRRVLRPGGRVALAVWGAPERNAWFSVAAALLRERGHLSPPEADAPGPFSMASEERTAALLRSAGFESLHIGEVPVRALYRDADHYLSFSIDTAGPVAMAMRQLAEAERKTIREVLAERFAPFASDEGYALPGVALCAVAR